MRKLILSTAFIIAFATPALAQQQDITLRVTNDDVNMLGKALGKLPFDEVAPLINKLRTQITEQQTPPKAPETPKPSVPEQK